MKKVFEQDLGGNQEIAKRHVKYTWQKDEIAYYFCKTYKNVFKVQFTGENWFLLHRYIGSVTKIYQFKYLECSNGEDVSAKGYDSSGISHSEEDVFYTTKQEAIAEGDEYLIAKAKEAIESFEKYTNFLRKYEKE